MRAFVAIDLPELIRGALRSEQAAFRQLSSRASRREEGVRWTRPEGIHLTLKFLGEVAPAQVQQVTEALDRLSSFDKFLVEVKGFGFFPDARRPRVFWAGVVAPPELSQLAQRIEVSLETLGFAPENRSFTPHLTLARLKNSGPQPALQTLVEERREQTLGQFEVSEFFLFESKLSPGGVEYLKVARFHA